MPPSSPKAAEATAQARASGDLWREGEVEKAVEKARAAVDAAGPNPRDNEGLRARAFALQMLGLALAEADRPDEALSVAEQLKAIPGTVSWMGVQSTVARMRCDFDAAADLQLQIRAKSPPGLNDAPTEGGLAAIDLLEGRDERAVERFEHALSLPRPSGAASEAWDAGQAEMRRWLAVAYASTGRRQKAARGISSADAAQLRGAAARLARYALAEKRLLFFAQHRVASAILASEEAGAPADEIEALRATLRELLSAYSTSGSRCRDVIADPMALRPPGVRARLGLAPRPADPSQPAAAPSAKAEPPPSDRDGDGIDDTADRCPDEPETLNGVDDDDGCPDQAPGLAIGRELRLREPIAFAHDSDKILPAAEPTLAWLAALIKAHPELGVVSIEGHTDDTGKAEHNLDLSRRRARSVVQALASRGVDAGRLSSKGFGSTRPKVLGTDDAARAQNRRVEILASAAIALTPPRAPTASPSAPQAPPPQAPPPPALTLDELVDEGKFSTLASSLKAQPAKGRPTDVLALLGFDEAERAQAASGKVEGITRTARNLDADGEDELVIDLHVEVDPPETEQGMTGPVSRHFLGIIDRSGGKPQVVARRSVSGRHCIAGEVSFGYERVHDGRFDDLVLNIEDAPGCNGNFAGTATTEIWTLERGRLETLLTHKSPFEANRQTGAVIIDRIKVRLTGKAPRRAELVDGKGKVKKKLSFDAATFQYR